MRCRYLFSTGEFHVRTRTWVLDPSGNIKRFEAVHNVMTRRSALLRGLGYPMGVLAFPWAGLAKDFWNERKPGDWSSGEIKELLTKSPWARDASITDNGQIGGLGNGRGAVARRGGRGGTGQGGATESGPAAKIQWKAIVRWESALPVQQALKSAAPKDGVKKDPPIKDIGEFYVLNVIGNLPGAISNADGSPDSASMQYLKEVSKLEHKGDQIRLSRVELAPESAVSPAGTLFYFSRVLALMLKDKEALFSTKIGPLDLKCKFALGDMLYRGMLEL
jgi:hypothetical protein